MLRNSIVCALLMLVAAAACPAQETEIRELLDDVEVMPGDTLEIDLDTGGDIEITSGPGNAVSVTADLKGESAPHMVVKLEKIAKGARLTSSYKRTVKERMIDAVFRITVPSLFDLKIKSMGGGISIEGVEGMMSGKTMGGALTLENLKGDLKLTTMGGAITLRNSEVDGKVKTMGGEVLMEDIFGTVSGESMGGNVILRNVSRPDGTSTGDEVIISTMGGNIEVGEAPAGAEVKTMGGDIVIESASDHVEAKTMGGDIILKAVDGRVKAHTMAGNVDVTIVGGTPASGKDVKLSSLAGDIRLVVPDGLPMTVEVDLAYTKNSSRDFKIISDFPISQRETDEWDYDNGTPRKHIYGTGSVNGGGNRIVLDTINGNIHLVKGN